MQEQIPTIAKATGKFTLRISPQEDVRLAMLAAKLGRSKSGTLKWLLRQASEGVQDQAAVLVKPKRKSN